MTHRPMLIAGVAAISLLASGCTVFRALGFHSAQRARPAAAAPALAKAATPVALPLAVPAVSSDVKDGRALLDAGNYGLAIDAFRRALGKGEETAASLNGLAVGYARIERVDLAERYFREAMAAAPGNAQFADNLDLLLRANEEKQRAGLFASNFDAVMKRRDVAATQQVAAVPVTGRLAEVSPHHFMITTAPGPIAAAKGRRMARNATSVPPGFKSLIRIEFAPTKPAEAPAEAPPTP